MLVDCSSKYLDESSALIVTDQEQSLRRIFIHVTSVEDKEWSSSDIRSSPECSPMSK